MFGHGACGEVLSNFDQGFSINDYVNEQISMLEKTKVQVASKLKKSKTKNLNLKNAVYGANG